MDESTKKKVGIAGGVAAFAGLLFLLRKRAAGDNEPPVTPPQDPWTEGVTVRGIEITPETVYLGQSVQITVYIDFADPTHIPETVHATISVDGLYLTGDFDTTYARLEFSFTPQHTGAHTVNAQDKSAEFTVLADITGTYYSPFGGTRLPLATRVVVPDVEPFTQFPQYTEFPGGDYEIGGISIFYTFHEEVAAQMGQAYPNRWLPVEAMVDDWARSTDIGGPTIKGTCIIMAVQYTCPPYWNSKEELAQMIAGYSAARLLRMPSQFIIDYGETCPTCDGSGEVWSDRRHRYDTCPTCHGLTKILNVSLYHGIRDWVKDPFLHVNCFYSDCTYWIDCPYCNYRHEVTVRGSKTASERLAFCRGFLNHIEEEHPDHPLTAPAWF